VRPLAGGLEAWVEAGRPVEGDAEALESKAFEA
jgi:3-mercaptopyruvate sulfurtransferase SseA